MLSLKAFNGRSSKGPSFFASKFYKWCLYKQHKNFNNLQQEDVHPQLLLWQQFIGIELPQRCQTDTDYAKRYVFTKLYAYESFVAPLEDNFLSL